MARWETGGRTVQYLLGKGRLESIEAEDLGQQVTALLGRADLRVGTTAAAALDGGDVDGAYMIVEDAVSAQFAADIPAFAKPTFERFRRTRHSAQYFDPKSPPITKADASWAIEKATAALSGVKALLANSTLDRFVTEDADRA